MASENLRGKKNQQNQMRGSAKNTMTSMRNTLQGGSANTQTNVGANMTGIQQNNTMQQSNYGSSRYGGNFNMQQKSTMGGMLNNNNKLVIALCRRPFDAMDDELDVTGNDASKKEPSEEGQTSQQGNLEK